MSIRISVMRQFCFTMAMLCVLFSSRLAADDHLDLARAELGTSLDGIPSTHFRRSMRVQTALLEYGREEVAKTIALTLEKLHTAAAAFYKKRRTSGSDKLNQYLASIGKSNQGSQLLESVFTTAVHVYFSGVVVAASGGFIWIDADDKTK